MSAAAAAEATALSQSALAAGWAEDGLWFASSAELQVYHYLRRRQRVTDPNGSLLIVPNAWAKLPTRRHPLRPDFLICYAGRAGIIEVDGPRHNGRLSQDRSRDRLFEDAGIAYIDHLDAEATSDPPEIAAIVNRFLRRLARGS